MHNVKYYLIAILLLALSGTLVFLKTRLSSQDMHVYEVGAQAYIYAYPLVIMEVTKNAMSDNGLRLNQFVHVSEFPDDTFRDIVRPNVDTLYSFAWLDLSHGPVRLLVPDTRDRYYILELMDAWTNVFSSIGKRTTGTKAQAFLIVGPFWDQVLPENMHIIRSPTNMVLILARTQTNGKDNYAFVRKIQEGYGLKALQEKYQVVSTHEPLARTAIGLHRAPVDQVMAMDIKTFYELFIESLAANPPAPADGPMLDMLRELGIIPGKTVQDWKPSESLLRVLEKARRSAFAKVRAKKESIKKVNGWSMMLDIGTYGTDYVMRALVAYMGIGANLPIDAMYPTAFVDGDGNPLNGKNRYVIHFEKDQLPPVHAFWSVTVYNAESFLVQNPLKRYGLGDRDTLQFNPDGSLDIVIQHESPGENEESNWLPAPRDIFNLTMRLYWPKQSVLDGSWKPPVVRKL